MQVGLVDGGRGSTREAASLVGRGICPHRDCHAPITEQSRRPEYEREDSADCGVVSGVESLDSRACCGGDLYEDAVSCGGGSVFLFGKDSAADGSAV